MPPHDVLRRLPRKVGLRVDWRDEGRVRRDGRERVLGRASFGAAEEGAEDGDEEVAAFLREDVPERGVCDVGRDGLCTVCVRVFTGQNQSLRGEEEEGNISYDGDASENIARVNAASTFHFDDANCGVAFAI